MLIWNLGAINQITRTFIYNFETLEWSNGPSLKVDREFPACGMIRDFVTDAKYLIVTGGAGRLYPSQHVLQLNSTEILDMSLPDNEWTQGEQFQNILAFYKAKMAFVFYFPAFVSWPALIFVRKKGQK